MFSRLTIVFILMCGFILPTSSYALTSKYDKWVKVLESPALEYTSPDRFTPFTLNTAPENISYWTSIIPYPEDRNENMYIVMPTLWLITPIVFVPENSVDYNNMVTGQEIDINKYLPEWVMHYPSTWLPWEVWNPVIFGHSNYYKNRPGKYKSIFADIMNLDANPTDEIWIYTKNNTGEYDLFKYNIFKSYETVPTDVGILNPSWWKEITVFACTDGLNGRRILKGELRDKNEILITYPLKFDMYDILNKIENTDAATKQKVVIEWVKRIEEIRANMWWVNTTSNKYKQYVLKYIEENLVMMY